MSSEHASSDYDLIDDICDRWMEPSGPTYASYEDRYETVPHVLAILRLLPVEQRMEAMGMVEVVPDAPVQFERKDGGGQMFRSHLFVQEAEDAGA